MKILDTIREKIETIKKNNEEYENILNNSSCISNLKAITENNNDIVEYKIEYITTTAPDINKNKAIIISKLIPITETYLTCIFTKEIKTNKEYYIIPTDKYIWIINEKEYGIMNYPNTEICSIIKNILLGKIVKFNNTILEISGNDNTITNFINIINNSEYRNNIIKNKIEYLCGITPTYQLIDKNKCGISIDNNNNIVLHNQEENYKCKITNINNYELLEDNSIMYSKKLNTTSKITTSKNNCYTITLRISTENKTFIMNLLEPNSLKSSYTKQDMEYINKINFAYKIIKRIDNTL